MPDGPGRFAQDYSCPALLRIPLGFICIRIRDSHPLRCDFPDASTHDRGSTVRSYYPCRALLPARFGLFPVRSPLLGESLLFSLPGGTKMFQFPPFASLYLYRDNHPSGGWVVPFGNRGIRGHLHLPRAYRSLSRPSSPPRAKASAMRPLLLSPMNPCKKHGSLILSAVDSYNLIYSLACVNMSKIAVRQT